MTSAKAAADLLAALKAAQEVIKKTRSRARANGCTTSIPYKELGAVQTQISRAMRDAGNAR